MKVKLIRPTPHPFENLVDDIAYMARVSNPNNQDNVDTNEKLIRYLVKHKHWSPFEMANIVLEIDTTRDIARQILRHRSFSFQEFSQRYAVSNIFQVREARKQDSTNRQNSIEMNLRDPEDRRLDESFSMTQHKLIRLAREAYEWQSL